MEQRSAHSPRSKRHTCPEAKEKKPCSRAVMCCQPSGAFKQSSRKPLGPDETEVLATPCMCLGMHTHTPCKKRCMWRVRLYAAAMPRCPANSVHICPMCCTVCTPVCALLAHGRVLIEALCPVTCFAPCGRACRAACVFWGFWLGFMPTGVTRSNKQACWAWRLMWACMPVLFGITYVCLGCCILLCYVGGLAMLDTMLDGPPLTAAWAPNALQHVVMLAVWVIVVQRLHHIKVSMPCFVHATQFVQKAASVFLSSDKCSDGA